MTNQRSGKSLFEPKTQVKADMGIGNTDTLEEGEGAIHNLNKIKNISNKEKDLDLNLKNSEQLPGDHKFYLFMSIVLA